MNLGDDVTTTTGQRGHIIERRQLPTGQWLYGINTDGAVSYYLETGIRPAFKGMSR